MQKRGETTKRSKKGRGARGAARPAAWGWKRWGLLAAAAGCALIAGPLAAGPLPEPPPEPEAEPAKPTAAAPRTAVAPSGDAGAQSEPATPPQATIEALRKEAIEVVDRLIRRFPGNADAAALMGTVYDRQGKTTEAVKYWRRVLEVDPNRADVLDALGSVALEKGDAEQAVTRWAKVVEVAPETPGIHGRLANALMSCGRTKAAVVSLQRQIKRTPRSAENEFQLGQAHLQLQEYEEAEGHYRAAIEIDPDHLGAHYGLGVTCARTGRPDQARQHHEKFNDLKDRARDAGMDRRSGFDLAAMTRRNVVETSIDAGRIYRVHGNAPQAELLWQRAAALDPQNWICRQELAGFYLQIGLNRKALAVCRQLATIESEHPACHLNTGVLLARLREFDAAEEALRKGIELAPETAAGYLSLVRVLMAANRKLPEAKTFAQRLVQLAPTAENYFLLGKVCHRNGDAAGALAAVAKSVELDPDNQTFQTVYAQLQQK